MQAERSRCDCDYGPSRFYFLPVYQEGGPRRVGRLWKALLDKKKIIVFPGTELTTAVLPCQALLILDATFPENLLHSVLTALVITPAPPPESKNQPTVQPIPQNVVSGFADLYEKLDSYD
jgi:hypothetical protein